MKKLKIHSMSLKQKMFQLLDGIRPVHVRRWMFKILSTNELANGLKFIGPRKQENFNWISLHKDSVAIFNMFDAMDPFFVSAIIGFWILSHSKCVMYAFRSNIVWSSIKFDVCELLQKAKSIFILTEMPIKYLFKIETDWLLHNRRESNVVKLEYRLAAKIHTGVQYKINNIGYRLERRVEYIKAHLDLLHLCALHQFTSNILKNERKKSTDFSWIYLIQHSCIFCNDAIQWQEFVYFFDEIHFQ